MQLRIHLLALAIVLLALECAALPAAGSGDAPLPVTPPTALDRGFSELYNLKFDRAHANFDAWEQEHPQDPLGPASHVSAYLFEQLHRLRILESSFVKEDRKPSGVLGARPDPRLRARFYEEIGHANAQAQAQLQRDPRNETALLALTIIYGTQADYLNLVERRPWASLTLFKKSNGYAQTLLRLNPRAYDAWLASGFTEYLAGSLPFYARWFIRFDSVKGDKQRAIDQLRMAAANGRYLRPFAKTLLAAVYVREKRTAEAVQLLNELRAEFPDNPLFVAQLTKLTAAR